MARSPSASACRTNLARSARRWARIPSPSSCPAIACWAQTARWAASRRPAASASNGAMPELAFDPRQATRHLRKCDPDLARVIGATGPFALELHPARSVFAALARAIVYQQLSNKAAATIFGRLCAQVPRGHVGLTPGRLLALSDAKIRG